jgi:hypothetical protein
MKPNEHNNLYLYSIYLSMVFCGISGGEIKRANGRRVRWLGMI